VWIRSAICNRRCRRWLRGDNITHCVLANHTVRLQRAFLFSGTPVAKIAMLAASVLQAATLSAEALLPAMPCITMHSTYRPQKERLHVLGTAAVEVCLLATAPAVQALHQFCVERSRQPLHCSCTIRDPAVASFDCCRDCPLLLYTLPNLLRSKHVSATTPAGLSAAAPNEVCTNLRSTTLASNCFVSR
jgi:hypothetical protein